MSTIFGFIFKPLGWLISTFYSLTHNYLISILLFALVIEIILSPLQIKQQKNSIKQAKLAPKINAIRKRYAGRNDNVSKQKMNQEIMEVYQQEGFNPAGGCLPMLIQLPIVLCVYQVIINPLTYLSGLSNEVITAIKSSELFTKMTEIQIVNSIRGQATVDIVKDKVVEKTVDISKGIFPDFHLFKLDLAVAPKDNLWPLILIPILVFLTTWGSVWIMKKFTYQAPETEEAQNKLSVKILNLAMPLFSAWISYMWVAVLGIYWAFRSVLSVVERFVISKLYPIPQPTDEEIKAAEKEAASRAKQKEEKKPVRSLHRIDEDDEELPPPTFDDDDEDEDEPAPAPAEDKAEVAGRGLLDTAPVKDGPSRKEKKNNKKEK